MKIIKISLFCIAISLSFINCNALKSTANNLNAFTVEQDRQLGDQVAKEISSKPKEYPILPENGNAELYGYVRGLANQILNSGKIKHRDIFAWKISIINDHKTLNAFCTPGGYIYVYTGLIKFLDSEDQLMGVLGHEIAHADERHSTEQLTKQYGMALLGDALLGQGTALTQVAEAIVGTLASMSFSRANETEADQKSVDYLCGSSINAAGAAGFFRKMGSSHQTATWLSTHPNPANRIQKIEERAEASSCRGTSTNQTQYQRIKALIK